MTQDKVMRVAAAVFGVVVVFGLLYIILKVTKCCSCCASRPTDPQTTPAAREEAAQESAHLTVVPFADVARNHENPAVPTPDEADSESDANEDAAGVNEVPPSYESLYLTEEGLADEPPPYTPPRHHAERNPPRRVHTFN